MQILIGLLSATLIALLVVIVMIVHYTIRYKKRLEQELEEYKQVIVTLTKEELEKEIDDLEFHMALSEGADNLLEIWIPRYEFCKAALNKKA